MLRICLGESRISMSIAIPASGAVHGTAVRRTVDATRRDVSGEAVASKHRPSVVSVAALFSAAVTAQLGSRAFRSHVDALSLAVSGEPPCLEFRASSSCPSAA